MFILMCPCIKDPNLRAEGITKKSDIEQFSRCIERCGIFGVEIVYLPCPETIYLGKERKPGSFLEKLDTEEFAELISRLSLDVKKIIEEKGKPLCIIGVDSSPACGVNTTYYSDAKEKGRGVFLKKFLDIPAFDVSEFSKYKIYFAAPLFSCAEREYNRKIAGLLRENMFLVHLPQEISDNQSSRESCHNIRIFNENLLALKEADIVVSVIDGADADSGTSWEMGYAYASGKKIISIRTDFRRVGDNECANLMLEESSVVVNSTDELLSALNTPLIPVK
ncbi:MAG: nucleoside 2-deoxyribosyltransferase [Methanomicrobium sp.]|nr:nucleoside 2-deoxyribosyltransferase [Methanomicrobium sp.]